jgi:hypothetical protein
MSDAVVCPGTLTPAALTIDTGMDVSAVPAWDAFVMEQPASRNTDAKSIKTGRRRLIDLLCQSRPRPPDTER